LLYSHLSPFIPLHIGSCFFGVFRVFCTPAVPPSTRTWRDDPISQRGDGRISEAIPTGKARRNLGRQDRRVVLARLAIRPRCILNPLSPKGRGRAAAGNLRIVGRLRLSEARERASVVRGEVAGGADPQAKQRESRRAAATALTFDELSRRYLEEYAKPRKSSWANDQLYLARPRAALGDRAAKKLVRRDFIRLLDDIKSTAPVSANRTQSVLVTLLNWAADEELIDINVMSGARKRAAETPRERSLSDVELKILWGLIDQSQLAEAIRSALLFLMLVGQRPGEVVGIRCAELFDLDHADRARWEIPAERHKSRRKHLIPLPPLAASILKPLVKGLGPKDGAFSSRYGDREVLARHSLSQALRRVLEGPPRRRADSIPQIGQACSSQLQGNGRNRPSASSNLSRGSTRGAGSQSRRCPREALRSVRARGRKTGRPVDLGDPCSFASGAMK
jgi:integrase